MTVDELAQKIKDANGNPGHIRKAEQDFVDAGGTQSAPEGGKVFKDTDGGKVFVTDGGKVFNNRP
jgi:hypothetical protein